MRKKTIILRKKCGMKRVSFHSRQCLRCVVSVRYLEAERVEADVCLAANRPVGLNLHGVEQVLLTETGRPAHLEPGLLNAAGPKVVELEMSRKEQTWRCLVFY